jgi:hypothetical protein
MTYIPYPRRLYLNGEVIDGDLHATNSVVVQDEAGEAAARANGYRKAYEPESISGNGSSSAPAVSDSFTQDQGAVAGASADPIEALRAEVEALGLKPHHKAGEKKLREMIAAAKVAA